MDNNKQLTNKKGLFINMREYYLAMGIDPFTVLPLTFHVKNQSDSEFQKFENEYKKLEQTSKIKHRELDKALRDYIRKKRKQTKNTRTKMYECDTDEELDWVHSTECDDPDAIKIKRQHRAPLNNWIIKPGENSNRGVGINVTNKLPEVKKLLSTPNRGKNNQESSFII